MAYRFIYLLGPEGAGKTTQARLLRGWLVSHGFKTLVVRVRTNHLGVHFLTKVLVKLGLTCHRSSDWPFWHLFSQERSKEFVDVRIRERLYPLILFLEVVNALFLSFALVSLPLAMGYVVLAENYVIDSIADLERRCRMFGIRRSTIDLVTRLLLRFMPNSAIVIVLDADYDELLRRYEWRRTPIEPKGYIDLRRKQITGFANLCNSVRINTGKTSIADTAQKIVRKVTE